MKKIFLFLLLFAVACLSGCTRKESAGPIPKEGGTAPSFTLKDLDGRAVKLEDFRGKVVLLNFWATWCPPCREEIPSMMKLNEAMSGKPFQMLAVSEDEGGKEAVVGMFRKSGYHLPVLLDEDQAIGKLYGLTGVPETFLLDKKGVILKKVVGGMDWADPQVISYISDLANRP